MSRVTFSPHVACVIPLRRHSLLNRSCSCTCHVFVLGIVLVTGSTAAKWRHYMHEVWASPRLCPRSDQAAVCAWHRERTSPIFCYPLLVLQSQTSAQQPTRTPQDNSLGATGRLEAPDGETAPAVFCGALDSKASGGAGFANARAAGARRWDWSGVEIVVLNRKPFGRLRGPIKY